MITVIIRVILIIIIELIIKVPDESSEAIQTVTAVAHYFIWHSSILFKASVTRLRTILTLFHS